VKYGRAEARRNARVVVRESKVAQFESRAVVLDRVCLSVAEVERERMAVRV
jgi:hypothetical protein